MEVLKYGSFLPPAMLLYLTKSQSKTRYCEQGHVLVWFLEACNEKRAKRDEEEGKVLVVIDK